MGECARVWLTIPFSPCFQTGNGKCGEKSGKCKIFHSGMMDESCCQTGKNKTKWWTFNLLIWKCSIFSKGFNYTQEEHQCVVHLSTIWWSGAPPRAVKNKKKLGGSAAMQGGLWACTQRPFDLSVNNSMILAIDLSPSSHIGMKLPVNTGVVKKNEGEFCSNEYSRANPVS